MTATYIIVEDPKDWPDFATFDRLITADDYIFGAPGQEPAGTHIINLCRGYRYLSTGYYCSLLAEARRHRVLPTVRTINDLSHKAIYSLDAGDVEVQPRPEDGEAEGSRLSLDVCFGETAEQRFAGLARDVFERFPAPVLRVELVLRGHWRINGLRMPSFTQLDHGQLRGFADALERFGGNRWRRPRARRRYRYDLAILHDPAEKLPPSNPRALANFSRVGRRMGFDVDMITRGDYGRLSEYDALFIRETTAISNHTYRFAKRAELEGIIVMDDPDSILRCTNKVFLADLLASHKVPTPASRILHGGRPADLRDAAERLGFPMVIKIPDGSFSRGVTRVHDENALAEGAKSLFRRSDLILAQEFVTSEYDWRIGVLAGKPIYACQYHFPKGHWQIFRHESDGRFKEGGSRTLAVSDAPRAVVRAAVKAASLIGNGLYGVDVKQVGDRVVVIEVNDNPNLDAGVEDAYLGQDLYRLVLEEFARRLEAKRRY